MNINLLKSAENHLNKLCIKIGNRCVGSEGNIDATQYFYTQLTKSKWDVERQKFDAFDWNDLGASLEADGQFFQVQNSPYGLSCNVTAPLILASNEVELHSIDTEGKILVLHDWLTKDQLMPKSFVFYNPESHKKRVAFLEQSGAKAIVFIINQGESSYAGGEYPFPIIEDGDFQIPSVMMTEEDGQELLQKKGKLATLISKSTRKTSFGENIIGRKGHQSGKRIVITAHIDAKKGTPGAIDNASGVVILLLLGQILSHYVGDYLIELVTFNGEDYYSVPGQMEYVQLNQELFPSMLMNINIDGAGLQGSQSSFSFFQLPPVLEENAKDIIQKFTGIVEGKQWVQSDHSIFVQNGVPAIAVSSEWLVNNFENQDITHTEKDHPNIVDVSKLVEIAEAIALFVQSV